MAVPMVLPPDLESRETESLIQRFTRGGRELWYQLNVLQQPQRARACGSGQKAASDRRPVDPPPVVELKIFEGKLEDRKEITFDYNANFILFASLHNAREIAPGRNKMHVPPTNSPVLTGVPVSGMAYLDRPHAAGYFIFPDLSVRHEGCFKITFGLYETTKEEKDLDVDTLNPDGLKTPGVDWRMEVSTLPFHVYSAKKFPGLMESTSLSKTVADQGCRVRIRRDVRMRKRDGKSGRRDDEASRHRTVTPATDDPRSRDRSSSGHSEHRIAYPDRRPSGVEGYVAAHPAPPPPPPTYDMSTVSTHLGFGAHNTQYTHVGPPRMPPSPPDAYLQAAQPRTEPPPYYYPSRPSSQTSSGSMGPASSDHYHRRQVSNQMIPASSSVQQPMDRRDSLTVPYQAHLPPIQSPPTPDNAHKRITINQLVTQSLPAIEAQKEPLGPPPVIPTGGKRKHENVFSQSSAPLYNRQRQTDPHLDASRRGMTPDPDFGVYYRADGQQALVQFSQYY